MPALKAWQIAWWDAQPEQQTCRYCGVVGGKDYTQPEVPNRRGETSASARCVSGPCADKRHAEYRAARKAELGAERRCEVPGCSRRGSWTLAHVLLVCGSHRKKIEGAAYRKVAGSGLGCLALGGAGPVYNRGSLLALAQQPKEG